MTQISKKSLGTDTEKSIYDMFTHVLAGATSQKDIANLLFDFLTETERVMLPKRICIAYLIVKGHDQRSICQYLKVSFTTITKISTTLKNGGSGYKTLLDQIQKNTSFTAILQKIEAGLGPVSPSQKSEAIRKQSKTPIKKTVYKTPHSMADRTPDIL